MSVTQTVLPLANYPNQTDTIVGPVSIGDAITDIVFALARCTTATPTIWPLTTTFLTFMLEQSNDGGVTWIRIGGASSNGGIALDDFGQESPTFSDEVLLQAGTSRQLRMHITITGGPLRTQGTVTVT